MARMDLKNKRIGMLTVNSEADSVYDACGTLRTQWFCTCDCGATVIVKTRYLNRGDVKSCKKTLCVKRAKNLKIEELPEALKNYLKDEPKLTEELLNEIEKKVGLQNDSRN